MKIGLFSRTDSDRPMLAIVLLLVATFTLGLQDSLMKFMSSQTSFWQIQTLRSTGNLLLLILMASFTGSLALLLPVNWKAVYLRALFLAVCMFFFFSGAPFLTVAQMATGLYTYPFFICVMAGPLLGETLGPWRLASICLGISGALLILSPWQDGFSVVQLLPILAGFFFACNIITLRRACRHESTLALAFATGVVFLISGLCGIFLLTVFAPAVTVQQAMPYVAIGWPQLTLAVAAFAVLASLLNLTGNICLSRAYQTADSSLLAPLDFSYLIFAAIWGKILFDQWPTPLTLFGMLLIISAGATIAWREQLNARSSSATNPGSLAD